MGDNPKSERFYINIMMKFLMNEKKTARFLRKTIANPNLSFLIYFILVAIYGFIGNQLIFFYSVIAPWLVLIILILNIPFFRILFTGIDMTENEKKNHVLEHGTIHFLKSKYGKKHKMSGHALNNGFRIGGIKSKIDIQEAFDMLRQQLSNENRGIVLSKYCGSNIHILQGASLIVLTLTFAGFIFFDIGLIQTKIMLLINLVFYMLFRYPIGKYFQKRQTMSFNFSDASVKSIEKAKTDILEASPVYIVETEIL